MLLDSEILVTCSGRDKAHYEGKGYKLPYAKDKRGRIGIKKGSKIYVKTEDLPKCSQRKIRYKCDSCGVINSVSAQTIFSRSSSQYNKTKEAFCSMCANSRMSGVNSGVYKHGSARYSEYRWNARKRGIFFDLSPSDFIALAGDKCHYCGGNSKDRNPKSRGNGIDRKDSKNGYTIDNCVSCCITCNTLKNSMSYVDFIEYAKQLYETIIKHIIQQGIK